MLAYLYSRYPVVSQTFCDSEMMALEGLGFRLVVGSLNPPPDSFRHARLDRLRAEVLYPPPPAVLKALPALDPERWRVLAALAGEHAARFGEAFKPELRARNALWFFRRFRERGVGHVHVHFANRATHTALFLEALGLPFSFTAHARDFLVDLGSDALLGEMCRKATFVGAVSDFSRDLLADRFPDAADRIVRIYNGIDPAEFAVAPPPPPDPDGRLRVASVGRLVEFKGFHDLIEAVARLRDRGVPAVLRIVGEGPERPRLEALVRDRDLGDAVVLHGSQSQEAVGRLLGESDVFALACTEDREGGTDILPTVILEAMATGLPVVSTRFVGVPEMVEDGVTGQLANPGDPEGLAAALAGLAADPPRARALGRAGRLRFEERFSLRVTAPRLGALLPAESDGGSDRQAGEAPRPVRLAFLVDRWRPGDPAFAAECAAAAADPEIVPLAMNAGDPTDDAAVFLPDGVVLEACWRRADDRRAEIDRLRADLGTAVDGEAFYRDARRALWIGDWMRRRGIPAAHAGRSETLVLAWLLHRLFGVRTSCTVESRPVVARSAVARLADAFHEGALGDPRLRGVAGIGRFDDPLGLAAAAEPRRGLLRRRLPPPIPGPDLLQPWLARLKTAAVAAPPTHSRPGPPPSSRPPVRPTAP